MPLCTLHLLALHRTSPDPLPPFLLALRASPLSPLVVSRVIRWIILPSTLSTAHLLAHNISWDILLVVPGTYPLPPALTPLVSHAWSVTAGIPSRLVAPFPATNAALLHPEPSTVPPLATRHSTPTTPSAQALELSAELDVWIDSFLARDGKEARGAVSMFNLLAFNPGMKDEYLKYGAAFAAEVGAKHGGNAKLVGGVTHVNGVARGDVDDKLNGGVNVDGKREDTAAEWDEIALAHYPSIAHFRDMLASPDYQAVNHRHRVPSLRDTCILMTSEVGVAEMEVEVGMEGRGRGGARL